MTTNVTQLRVTVTALRKAEARVKELRTRRDQAIADLVLQGLTTEEVAIYAELTQPRITQIAQKARGG